MGSMFIFSSDDELSNQDPVQMCSRDLRRNVSVVQLSSSEDGIPPIRTSSKNPLRARRIGGRRLWRRGAQLRHRKQKTRTIESRSEHTGLQTESSDEVQVICSQGARLEDSLSDQLSGRKGLGTKRAFNSDGEYQDVIEPLTPNKVRRLSTKNRDQLRPAGDLSGSVEYESSYEDLKNIKQSGKGSKRMNLQQLRREAVLDRSRYGRNTELGIDTDDEVAEVDLAGSNCEDKDSIIDLLSPKKDVATTKSMLWDNDEFIERMTPAKVRRVSKNSCVKSMLAEDSEGVHFDNEDVSEHGGDGNEAGMCVPHKRRTSRLSSASLVAASAAWRVHIVRLERLKSNFFRSPEAKLRIRSRAQRGRTVYEGIGATEKNCLGLRKVLELCCSEGGSQKARKELITTVSQFLRWCVVCSVCRKYDVWKEEALFGNIGNMELVEELVVYFQARCETPTVKKKVAHLLMVCEVACSNGDVLNEKGITEVRTVLQNIGGSGSRAT